MAPTIFLFDIDGTLLRTDGAGRRAFKKAFEVVCGRGDACESYSFAGMTDGAIIRRGLEAIGRAFDRGLHDEILATYLQLVAPEVRASNDFTILPAATETLEYLNGVDGFAVGVGTGNVRAGAELKLGRAGLLGHIHFGGYGCDSERRPDLLRCGAERGATKLGRRIEECRVVVIGDTVHDVNAAKAIGAECIGVGTGGVELDVLETAGATLVFESLASSGALQALAGSGS